MKAPELYVDIPPAYGFLFDPATYYICYGGRGAAKSWSIARALVAKAYTSKVRILCTREFQASMTDSVLRLLADQIDALGLSRWFDVQAKTIICTLTGSEFIFKGLRRNAQEIKSTERVDITWIEEASSVSEESWLYLIPTVIRTGNPQIYVSFNPYEHKDPTYQRFVVNPPANSLVVKTSWRDNPAFSAKMDEERRYMLANDPTAYDWVWEGFVRQLSDAVIFKDKVTVEAFETPEGTRFFHGADWGFASDPSTLIRCYIVDNTLFVDQEAYGHGIELDDLPAFFDRVPTSRQWPIRADNSQPAVISYVGRQGFMIAGADKWPGSVEDGIKHLRGFRKIVVHERCVHTAQEFRLYSYKQDVKTKDVLPVIVDKHNHCVDAIRYSLDGYIQARGGAGRWIRLAD